MSRSQRFAAVAARLKAGGRTQAQIADALGLGSGTRISEYLTGRTVPSERVVRLAEAIELDSLAEDLACALSHVLICERSHPLDNCSVCAAGHTALNSYFDRFLGK